MTFTPVRRSFRRDFCKPLLAPCWCIGLILGLFAAGSASDVLVPMIRSALSCSVSFTGLLISAVLPFLLSAVAVSLSEPWLLLPISALKAFGFGYCACGVCLAFGSAGWLVRVLFLFTDVCVTPVLFFYWLRHTDGTSFQIGELAACVAAAAAVAAADYYLISPFLAMVIEF